MRSRSSFGQRILLVDWAQTLYCDTFQVFRTAKLLPIRGCGTLEALLQLRAPLARHVSMMLPPT
jgi:hypothetical protein